MNKLINKLYKDSLEYLVNWRKHTKEYAWAIVIVLIIRSSLGVIYRIPTASMIPTFRQGDILIGNRFYYGLKLPFADAKDGARLPAVREPEIGDVVIIQGPREAMFYDLVIDYREKDYPFLKELNEASKFKGIIDNDSFPAFPQESNYIVLEFSEDKAIIHLYEEVYATFKDRIEEELTIFSSEKGLYVMNYDFPLEESWVKTYLSTPIAGISILATVIYQSPFFFLYDSLIKLLSNDFSKTISFYPNRFIDNTKEYVKRFVAKEGDVVEIRNKVLYINGQVCPWSKDYEVDPYISSFKIYQEFLRLSKTSSSEQFFEHPLRIGESYIRSKSRFDSEDWPFEPETLYAANFRDDFGPITVPKDHLFMLGDNRDESLDSRYIGAVPKWLIKGKPYFIFYPWSRSGVVK